MADEEELGLATTVVSRRPKWSLLPRNCPGWSFGSGTGVVARRRAEWRILPRNRRGWSCGSGTGTVALW